MPSATATLFKTFKQTTRESTTRSNARDLPVGRQAHLLQDTTNHGHSIATAPDSGLATDKLR